LTGNGWSWPARRRFDYKWESCGPDGAQRIRDQRHPAGNGDTLEIHGTRVRLWGIDAPGDQQRSRK